MKCLVLLLAVALCQGIFLKDELRRPDDVVNLRNRVYRKTSQIGDLDQLKYDQEIKRSKGHKHQVGTNGFRTPWQRRMDKNILQTPRQQQMYKEIVQTFQHQAYKNSFQTPWQRQMYKDVLLKPWQNQMNDNFGYNWKDEMTFPESDFLLEEFMKRLFKNVPEDVLPVTDFDLVEKIKTDLSQNLPTYWTLARDPNSMALAITRLVMKDVLDKRQTCGPILTKWRRDFWTIFERLNVHTETETELMDFLNTRLPRLLEIDQEMATQLTYWFTKDMELTVDTDLSRYLVGVGIKDIAVASHKLYRALKEYLEEVWTEKTWTNVPETTMFSLVEIIQDVVADCTRCPTIQDYSRIEEMICWNLDTQFLEQENDKIVYRFKQYLNIVYNVHQSFDVQREFPRYFPRNVPTYMTSQNEQTLKEIVENIRSFIRYNVKDCLVQLCRRIVYSPNNFQRQMLGGIEDTQRLSSVAVDQDQIFAQNHNQIRQELDQLQFFPTVKSSKIYRRQAISKVQMPWKRQMYKNILKQLPGQRKVKTQTPFKHETFSNLVQTPWSSQINDIFGYNWRDEMTFPESDFLLQEFWKRWTKTARSEDVTFTDFDLLNKVKMDLAQHLPTYRTLTRDPNTMALMITRMVMKDVLDKRQTCELVVVQARHVLDNILERIQRVQTTTVTEIVDFLETRLPRLVEVDQQTAMEMALWFTKDMQLTVDKDFGRYLVDVGIEDIAVASHKLYHMLKEFFKAMKTDEMWTPEMAETTMSSLFNIIEDVVAPCINCPTLRNHNMKVETVCRNLDTQFLQQETDKVVYRFKQLLNYFTNQVQQPMNFLKEFPRYFPQDVPTYLDRKNEWILKEIVEMLRSYIWNNVEESMMPLCRWNVYSSDYFQQQIVEPNVRRINQKLPWMPLPRWNYRNMYKTTMDQL